MHLCRVGAESRHGLKAANPSTACYKRRCYVPKLYLTQSNSCRTFALAATECTSSAGLGVGLALPQPDAVGCSANANQLLDC